MTQKIFLPTPFGYDLSVWIEGAEHTTQTVILVHGFAANKHEARGFFDDLTAKLGQTMRVVRFDFGGLGESGGDLLELSYEREAAELAVVIEHVRRGFGGELSILAHSMGCFITARLSPNGISKTILTGIPNIHTERIVERISRRYQGRPGSTVDLAGISTIQRTNGDIKQIGPGFWQSILRFKPLEAVAALAAKTQLLVIHPAQDDVVGIDDIGGYSQIAGVTARYLDGDHSFSKAENREKMMEVVKEWLEG